VSLQLVSKISNLCDHNPTTSQTDGRTDDIIDKRSHTAYCLHKFTIVIKLNPFVPIIPKMGHIVTSAMCDT